MSGPVSFVLHHPYLVLFGAVLAEQLGLPVPAMPFLLGAGALVGMNKLNPALALSLAVLASVLADLVWYEAGRRNTSARVALLLKQRGIERVRPLLGGFEAWKGLSFPVEG